MLKLTYSLTMLLIVFGLTICFRVAPTISALEAQPNSVDIAAPLRCIDFSPYVAGYNPDTGPHPDQALIETLLDTVIKQTGFRCIMTYGVLNGLDTTFAAAKSRGVQVIAILWLDTDTTVNANSIAVGIEKAHVYSDTITHIACGSELRTRHGAATAEPIVRDCIDQLKGAHLTQSVGSIDSWWGWCHESNPCQAWSLADDVDWIGINIFPWWENKYSGLYTCIPASEAAAFQIARFQEVIGRYPQKEVLLTEFGWPAGPDGYREQNQHTGEACGEASEANQQLVLEETLTELDRLNLPGVLFSAFREEWKVSHEGAIGAYWGICQGTSPYTCTFPYGLRERVYLPVLLQHSDSADVKRNPTVQPSTPMNRICPQDIQFGETIKCSVEVAAEKDFYVFAANKGDRVLIRLSKGSGSIWPGFTLYNPQGDPVTDCDAFNSVTAQQICELGDDGDYLLSAYDGFNGTYTGDYYLYLQRTNHPMAVLPLDFGQTVSGTISTPAQIVSYLFSGEANDQVVVRMSKSAGSIWPGISLYDPTGLQLEGCNASSSVKAQFICRLPSTGNYLLLAFDSFNGTYTGNYFVHLQRPNRPKGATAIHFGETISSTIPSPAWLDAFVFTVKANKKVLVTMSKTQGSLWPGISIYGPDGVEMDGCRASNSVTAQGTCPITTTGNYLISAYDSFNGTYVGDYRLSLSCLTPPCADEIKPNPALVLIYAVLDNNLGADPTNWERLVNHAEQGVHIGAHVRLLVDGPGSADSYVYNLKADSNPNCPTLTNPTCGYELNKSTWQWSEDTAHPLTLAQFITESVKLHPNASSIILSLVGHGSGWSANALPGQPTRWIPQPGGGEIAERIGGLLWDDHPGSEAKSRSLSTRALRQALDWAKQETGRPIDLLYLDACSMGIAEVAYELRNDAQYLLGWSNIAWAAFPYHQLLYAVQPNLDGKQIGLAWLDLVANAFNGEIHPFTLSLYDLEKTNQLVSATTNLADQLTLLLPAEKSKIQEALMAAAHYESDYNGAINKNDTYLDLANLAQQITTTFSTNLALQSAAQATANAVSSTVVIHYHVRNGHPWLYPEQRWAWSEVGGLSIYAPSGEQQDAKLALYTDEALQWAKDSTWDEFLRQFWSSSQSQVASLSENGTDPLPTCDTTHDCPGLTYPQPVHYVLYLPAIRR